MIKYGSSVPAYYEVTFEVYVEEGGKYGAIDEMIRVLEEEGLDILNSIPYRKIKKISDV